MNPISLKPWEVRAIQSGAKIIVRPIKPQPPETGKVLVGNYYPKVVGRDGKQKAGDLRYGFWTEDGDWAVKSPFGGPGEVLWGRETWAPYSADAVDEEGEVVYRASYDANRTGDAGTQGATKRLKIPVSTCVEWSREIERYEALGEKWRPSTQMPLWASRFRLEVKSVRCLRVQELSEADAIACGVEPVRQRFCVDGMRCKGACVRHGRCMYGNSPRDSFYRQFVTDHGPDAWDRNDWVAVCEFEKQETA